MPSRFFITGTDTGIGKTLVSALLCAALDAIYWKPIQTGTREDSDRDTVMRLAEIGRERTLDEAYRFAPPVSPHLAARLAGVRIDFRRIKLPKPPRLPKSANLITEGAGGALVPINKRQLTTDLMKHLGLPVLLVARTALGTINHTLLSIAALRAAKLDLRGVILSGKPNRENLRAIEHYGDVEVIGSVPLLKKINRGALLRVYQRNFNHRALER
jgi:dethiobiotin synthetase